MKKIVVDESKCKGCGICILVCPIWNIKMVKGKAKIIKQVCGMCRNCIMVCPENAIELK